MNYPFYKTPTPLPHQLTQTPAFSYHAQAPSATPAEYYLADEGLAAAVNVALLLGKPLLLTGEPGTGKTALAANLAYQLQLPPPLKFVVKSTSLAQDLFYFYNALGHYQAERMRRDNQPPTNPLDYVQLNALGLAIVATYPAEDAIYQTLKACLAPDDSLSHSQRNVVLIDEIDKAPRDFPNDLLNEIEHYYFHLQEWNNRKISVQGERKPIIVITSNSEKHLPDAFMRRCVYYHIPFPEPEQLKAICLQHVTDLYHSKNEADLNEALALFTFLRQQKLEKDPGSAELIDWLRILNTALFHEIAHPCRQDSAALRQSLTSLLKTSADQIQILGQDRKSGDLQLFFQVHKESLS